MKGIRVDRQVERVQAQVAAVFESLGISAARVRFFRDAWARAQIISISKLAFIVNLTDADSYINTMRVSVLVRKLDTRKVRSIVALSSGSVLDSSRSTIS